MHRFAAFVVLFSLFGSAHAQVTVKEAWVRATVPQQKVTGAFFHVTSAADARLVDARSPIDALFPIFAADRVAIITENDRFIGLVTRVDMINHFRLGQ